MFVRNRVAGFKYLWPKEFFFNCAEMMGKLEWKEKKVQENNHAKDIWLMLSSFFSILMSITINKYNVLLISPFFLTTHIECTEVIQQTKLCLYV